MSGAPVLQAKCASCHAEDGRDLKYFNYSNYVIEERSKFHGLSQHEGEQIASYIRSLTTPSPGRPWSPLFQPGPGLDSRPVNEWSAGAGINWSLDHDKDTQNYLPGQAIDPTAYLNPANPSHINQLNLREIPIALQLLDWNHWLPRVHPLDSIGHSFLNDPMYTRYQTIRQGLTGQSGMTKAQYIAGPMRADFDNWMLVFGGTGQASPLFSSLGPPDGQNWTPKQVREQYAAAVWSATKQWEIMQDFDLENLGKQFYGANGEARQWYSNRHLFNISPHILGMLNAYPVSGDGNTVLTNAYFANAWYEIQMLVNPGSRNAYTGGFSTIDWAYMQGLFGDLNRASGYGEPMRATLFAQKAMQEHEDGYGPDGPNESDPTTNAWWSWNLRDNVARMDRSLDDNWNEQPNPKPIVQTNYQVWMQQNARYSRDQWWKLSFGKPNDTYSLTAHDYIFDTAPNPDVNQAEILRHTILDLRQKYTLDEALLNGMADFGKLLWPKNNWDALKVVPPGSIPVPSDLKVTAEGGPEQAILSWTASNGATSYNVKRSTDPNGVFLPVAYFVNATSFTDHDLQAGQTYYYKVSANEGRYESNSTPAIAVQPGYGLVARWRFDENAGTAVATDSSSVGNNGELISNPARVNGRLGSALQLNGTNQYVGTEQALQRWLGGTATLTAWFNTTATGNNFLPDAPGITGATARGWPDLDQDSLWGMLDASGHIGAQFGWNGQAVKSAQAVNDGQWHHLAISRNAATGQVLVYIDGSLSASGTSQSGLMRRRFWSIGRIDNAQAYWSGGLDDVRVYDQVLNANDVQKVYLDNGSGATNLVVSRVAPTSLQLSWSNPGAQTALRLERATATTGPWLIQNTVGATASSYTDKNLVPGTTYYYRVIALSSGGDLPTSNLASGTTSSISLVVRLASDGGASVDSQTDGTLSYALSHATNGQAIGFDPAVSEVIVSGGLPAIPAGVTIYGGCGNNGPLVKLTGANNQAGLAGLVLGQGNITLIGLEISGFKAKQLAAFGTGGPNTGGNNELSCVKIRG